MGIFSNTRSGDVHKPIGGSGAERSVARKRKSRGPTLLTALLDMGKTEMPRPSSGIENRQPRETRSEIPARTTRSAQPGQSKVKSAAGGRGGTILTAGRVKAVKGRLGKLNKPAPAGGRDAAKGDRDKPTLIGPGGVNAQEIKPARPPSFKPKNPGPPTNIPINPRQLFKGLGFNPKGNTELDESIRTPYTAWKGDRLASESERKTEEQIRKGRFPTASRSGGEADAFRHAYWSYRMAQEIGPDAAKRFGDAHEISHPNPDPVRLMDLFNNNVGRHLALDPANKGRLAEEVILEAIKKGQLQTRPFKTSFTPTTGGGLRRRSQ